MLQSNETYVLYNPSIVELLDTIISIDEKFETFKEESGLNYMKDVKIDYDEDKNKWIMETIIWINNERDDTYLPEAEGPYGIL